MSYDLYFYREAESEFDADRARRYFDGQCGFKVETLKTGGFQAWYENETTGAYCSFEYGDPDQDDSAPASTAEFRYTGLYFSINFNRPTFLPWRPCLSFDPWLRRCSYGPGTHKKTFAM